MSMLTGDNPFEGIKEGLSRQHADNLRASELHDASKKNGGIQYVKPSGSGPERKIKKKGTMTSAEISAHNAKMRAKAHGSVEEESEVEESLGDQVLAMLHKGGQTNAKKRGSVEQRKKERDDVFAKRREANKNKPKPEPKKPKPGLGDGSGRDQYGYGGRPGGHYTGD